MKGRFVLRAIVAGLLAIASTPFIHAAGPNAEAEAAIRKIVASLDQGQRPMALSDEVFWSGAYLRPIVGTETAQPIPGKYSISNRVVGSQKRKTEIIRIVVADSGDLAYEYSKENLQFDVKAAEHVTLDTGILRVWQKDGGEWKIAARFSFPYDHVGIPVKDVK